MWRSFVCLRLDQLLAEMDDEVLHIGDDASCGQTASVSQFINGKFRNVYTVEINLPHSTI